MQKYLREATLAISFRAPITSINKVHDPFQAVLPHLPIPLLSPLAFLPPSPHTSTMPQPFLLSNSFSLFHLFSFISHSPS